VLLRGRSPSAVSTVAASTIPLLEAIGRLLRMLLLPDVEPVELVELFAPYAELTTCFWECR
jgi:hypothetical protein